MTGPPRVLISAGEASGDRLGAGLARELRAQRPGIELFGMGGELMAAEGVEMLEDSSAVAVVGISEVLRRLPRIHLAMRRLETALRDRKPDLLVPIDFPDFNLRLAVRSRTAAVPVVYFVSPQVWAWRRSRVRTIKKLVRRMLVLFPFEVEAYETAGVPVTFVGHPVAERGDAPRPREELLRRVGLEPGRRTVALMPGSRHSEISRLLPTLLESARILEERKPELQFLLPVAPGVDPAWLAGPLEQGSPRHLRTHRGDFPEVLTACDAGVVASGTASLETAVAGLPAVVVYKVSPLTHLLGRMLVQLDEVALPNLVAGRAVLPELIQGDCRPDRIAGWIERWLDDPAESRRLRAELAEIRRALGSGGVFARAARAVLEEVDRNR
jgi:lipid-A-disaccharide synthase